MVRRAVQGETSVSKVSLLALAKNSRNGLKTCMVLLVMAVIVTVLSDYVFSPWHFQLQGAEDALSSTIPRIGVRP